MKRRVIKPSLINSVSYIDAKTDYAYISYDNETKLIYKLCYINNQYYFINIFDIGTKLYTMKFESIESALLHILNNFPEYDLYEFRNEEDLREYLKSEI
jgi:hypothetical protein